MGDRYSGRSPPRRGPPIRDRPPPRDRDDHPDVEYFGAGESYRPGGQTGDGPYRPRDRDRDRISDDRWSDRDRRDVRDDRRNDRNDRSDIRRDDRREEIDSYIPPTSIRAQRARSRSPPPYRRRSRTPPRGRPELFPQRPISPRRSPRSDRRSPIRRRSRSPFSRNRSPDIQYARNRSPEPQSRNRSPLKRRYSPSPKRDSSPRRFRRPSPGFRPRSRSPRRFDDNLRRRSPSPRGSGTNSRRSSPHFRDTSLAGSRPQSPVRSRYDRSPRESRDGTPADRGPPSGPRGYRPSNPRQSPPFAPPAGPRGPARDFTSPTIASANLNASAMRGRTSLTYRAPGYRGPPSQPSFEAPPVGPRSASFREPSTNFREPPAGPRAPSARTSSYNNDFPFRPTNNSSSSTYPRTQRFDVPGPSSVSTSFAAGPNIASPVTPSTPANFVKSQMNTLERIVPGGKHIPGSGGLSADQEKRMEQLEKDAERMRAEIAEKQKMKRESLREWDTLERESAVVGLRSQLADEHLRVLGEDDVGMVGAAF